MDRVLYDEEHDLFRDSVRAFLAKEVEPHHEAWEADGLVPRELFTVAGRSGLLGMQVPEEHGGGGAGDDFRFNAILGEEACAAGVASAGLSLTLHNDICLPYFLDATNEEQKRRWLPGIAAGELVTAVAMTEPGTGSDLAGIRTSAVRDGDHYVVNGAKTFITNGINADLVITAVRTSDDRHGGLTLLVLERGMEGFERGRNLDKIGLKAQDTAELSFADVHVPVANRLGEEGDGFRLLTANLAQERLSIAIAGVASARAAVDWTIQYTTERTAFGKRIADFQNTKFELADMDTQVQVTQSYVDRCIEELNAGRLTAPDAARAKLWCTELQNKVLYRCTQLFGGYGYMREYPVARAYADARIATIYGGTSEIMKTIIAKDLGI